MSSLIKCYSKPSKKLNFALLPTNKKLKLQAKPTKNVEKKILKTAKLTLLTSCIS